jgi:hypothetical protein
MITTMTDDPELKELTRLGRRLKKLEADRKALLAQIKEEVKAAKALDISDERIAGAVQLSRLTVAKMKADN